MAQDIVPAAVRRRRRTGLKALAFALVLAAPTLVGSTAALAAKSVNCNGVFPGLTPSDPIRKSANTTSVEPGGTVEYTVTWTPNGVKTVDFVDCFLVDYDPDTGTSNAALDPLVESLNIAYDSALDVGDSNDGTETFTVQIPNDPALIGHTIVNRVKCGQGCQESKSDYVSVSVVAPVEPAPPAEEICGNGIDDDGDGDTDEGCIVEPPAEEICDNGIDDDGDGETDEGCAIALPPSEPLVEICDNGIDDDGDGDVDEDCGEAPPTDPVEEICDNGIDDDGDGETDEGCAIVVPDPEPTAEICDNGIDDDGDGEVDEDCAADIPPVEDDTDDVVIDDPITPVEDDVDDTVEDDEDTVEEDEEEVADSIVLPGRIVRDTTLAETGAETVTIAWLGALLLVAGSVLRFVRIRPVGAAFAGSGAVAQQILLYGMMLRARATRRWPTRE